MFGRGDEHVSLRLSEIIHASVYCALDAYMQSNIRAVTYVNVMTRFDLHQQTGHYNQQGKVSRLCSCNIFVYVAYNRTFRL